MCNYVLVTQIAQKLGSLCSLQIFLIRYYKDFYFSPDVAKYTGYRKILIRTGFRRLCTLKYWLVYSSSFSECHLVLHHKCVHLKPVLKQYAMVHIPPLYYPNFEILIRANHIKMQFSNLHFGHGLFDALLVDFQGQSLFYLGLLIANQKNH